MSNRVEELEAQVAELQAAVDGLTEELVESRERLRRIESEHGIDVTRAPNRRSNPEPTDATDRSADSSASMSADSANTDEDEAEATESEGSDIIVA